MRKIFVTLLVLALCTPAMAVTVDVATDGTVTLDSTEDGVNIVGVSLDLSVDGGATINALATAAPWDIYPDAGYDLGAGYTYGAAGTSGPAAIIAGPGQATMPANPVAISFGNLNGASTPGADGALVVTFTVTPDVTTNLTVIENAARGGIVAVDGTSLDISAQTGAQIIVGGGVCWTGDAASLAEWNAVGSPDCWCISNNGRQCKGDADGIAEGKLVYYVSTLDLGILLNAFNKPIGTMTGDEICADFDHQPEGKLLYRASTVDLSILLTNFNVAGGPAATCADVLGVQ